MIAGLNGGNVLKGQYRDRHGAGPRGTGALGIRMMLPRPSGAIGAFASCLCSGAAPRSGLRRGVCAFVMQHSDRYARSMTVAVLTAPVAPWAAM